MSVRVLIVDDSNFFRRQIKKFLSADAELDVVGMAENGLDAVEKALTLRPDVITMDIEMPIMDGIKATREIMRQHPVPILMFSSLTTDGAKATLDAMDAGAVDFIPKYFEDISRNRDDMKKILCAKILEIGKHGRFYSRRKSTLKPKLSIVQKKSYATIDVLNADKNGHYKLLAIGTSTGGPVALQEILTNLPQNFPVPIVMVQHMPATFTPTFSKRLDKICAINVKEAQDGDVLEPGCAYLAPGGKQMTIENRSEKYCVTIAESDAALTYRPSVDVTFSSLAKSYNKHVLSIILTGMGMDGCEGAKKLKSAGSTVWAQDKESCVVYGMPAAVYEAGITDRVLSLKDFSSHILRQF